MEYCPFSLQLLIEKSINGHLAIPYAHKYFKQLIDGLEYIHAHNVIREFYLILIEKKIINKKL